MRELSVSSATMDILSSVSDQTNTSKQAAGKDNIQFKVSKVI